MDIKNLFKELSDLPQVETIALGGSRATGKGDERSDYDVYVYVMEEIPEKARKEILERYCSKMEIGNHYWESEDNCVLKDGVDIDIIYRSLDDFLKGIEHVVIGGNAGNGYTTCMWHNLLTCQILYDSNGRLLQLCKEQCNRLPDCFEENLEKLFHEMYQGDVCEVIAEIVGELKKIIETEK